MDDCIAKNRLRVNFLDDVFVNGIVSKYVSNEKSAIEEVANRFVNENKDIAESYVTDAENDKISIKFKNGQVCELLTRNIVKTAVKHADDLFDVVINVSYRETGTYSYTVNHEIFGFKFPKDFLGKIRRRMNRYFKPTETKFLDVYIDICPELGEDFPKVINEINKKKREITGGRFVLYIGGYNIRSMSAEECERMVGTQGIKVIP